MVLVLLFSVRGLIRGLVAQAFAVVGVIAGLWMAGWTTQWVGGLWDAARPAVVFWILRWVVVALAGLTVATLFRWWGQPLGAAFRATPAGFLDRPAGFALGAGLGMVVASLLLLLLLLAPGPEALGQAASRARVARPLMSWGATACERMAPFFPGSDWLVGRFKAAARRVGGATRPS